MKPAASRHFQQLQSLSANIKRIRVELKLTQMELSEKADVELQYLQKLEYGQKNPSIAIVWSIAKALNVKIDDLLSEAQLVKDKKGRPRKKL